MGKEYQICSRCIMDTTDPSITFDANGFCSDCSDAIELSKRIWFPGESGDLKIRKIFEKIRNEGKDKDYDCITGLSGGVDSSYLAYLCVRHGLRPLVVHIDCGWNSKQAVKNIENIVRKLNLELHTFVVNWEEMKDLQRAFFMAGVPDQDIPQDHAIFAALYRFAEDNDVKYVMNGFNFATECIMPPAWGHQAMDYRHLKAVHNRFGQNKLNQYPAMGFLRRYVYYKFIKKMEIIYPLNYLEYRKEEAISLMKKELEWEPYGEKHHESRFTRFFQTYYLPVKFNIDKRRAHLSSMIVSGQISREDALKIVNRPSFNKDEIAGEIEYIAKKLDWSVPEFTGVLNATPHRHQDYPTNDTLFRYGMSFRKLFR